MSLKQRATRYKQTKKEIYFSLADYQPVENFILVFEFYEKE